MPEPLTKTHALSASTILEGLGLSPKVRLTLRRRLARHAQDMWRRKD